MEQAIDLWPRRSERGCEFHPAPLPLLHGHSQLGRERLAQSNLLHLLQFTQILEQRVERAAFMGVHFLQQDRKSVVWGKSVSVRVDLGGRRIFKKTNTQY